MAVSPGSLIRPTATADYRAKSSLHRTGLIILALGFMVAMAAFASSLVQASAEAGSGTESGIIAQAAWTFGVATAALGTLKTGIAVILWGIVRRLWVRVESIKEALPRLLPQNAESAAGTEGPISTPYGAGRVTRRAPGPLPIHRMAYALWAPMLLMGVMGVGVGLAFSFLAAQTAGDADTSNFLTLRALSQGTEFLGEGLLLSGISFLLGSILGSLRQGGGEVQESLGTGVKTLIMPLTAKLFVGLMMIGLMIEMVQFGLYVYVATLSDAATITAYFTWLAPLREAGLGILLSGIVLSLAAIGTVLGFQFRRIQELVATGR